MFLIFGTRGLKHTVSDSEVLSGSCPNCEGGDLQKKLYRRWFTLFFIPVIPLDVIDRFYQCLKCDSAYNENIKDQLQQSSAEQTKQQEEAKKLFANAVIASMTHMAMIDGDYADEEDKEIKNMIVNFSEFETELLALNEKIKKEGNKDNQVFDLLSAARNMLSSEALLNILAQAGIVLLADGRIDEAEEDLMKDYLLSCGLPKDMYAALIDKLKIQQLAQPGDAQMN